MTAVPKFRLFNRGTARAPNYWVSYTVAGEEVTDAATGRKRKSRGTEYRESTGAKTKRGAEEFVTGLERLFRTGRWVAPKDRDATDKSFATYAPKVIARRAARGVKTASTDEASHVHVHLIPLFGRMQLEDLKFKVIRDAFTTLERKGLAGRTVRNIHSTLRAILLEAADEGLIVDIPHPLTAVRGHLPPPADKDPNWRESAVFDRDELAVLLRCEAIPAQFRVMYATYFLTGSRASEVLPVLLRHYDRTKAPLRSLRLPALKTKRAKGKEWRVVPVHPELQAWLDWWVDDGFERTHARVPRPDDLLFPTMSPRRREDGHLELSYSELYMQWFRNHLPAAGLRHRRLHDSRRTFISIARSSGAPQDVTRAITHRTSGDRVLDAYTTLEWGALCEAISAIKWLAPAPPAYSVVADPTPSPVQT